MFKTSTGLQLFASRQTQIPKETSICTLILNQESATKDSNGIKEDFRNTLQRGGKKYFTGYFVNMCEGLTTKRCVSASPQRWVFKLLSTLYEANFYFWSFPYPFSFPYRPGHWSRTTLSSISPSNSTLTRDQMTVALYFIYYMKIQRFYYLLNISCFFKRSGPVKKKKKSSKHLVWPSLHF